MTNTVRTIALFSLALFSAFPASAQQSAADPRGLPGDMPPPPLERMLQPPSHRAPPPPDTTVSPPMDLALEAAQAAVDACSAQGLLIGVAVTDSIGTLKVGLMNDGASPGRIYSGVHKALAAIEWKQPTSATQAMLQANPAAGARLKPNMVAMPGAVPLFAGNRLIGAIGVSGATGQQDEACAAAGAARIKERLR